MGQCLAKLSMIVVWVAASLQPVYGRSPLYRPDAMVDGGGRSVMRRSLLLDSLNRDGNRLLTTPRLRYRHEIEMGSRYSDFNVDSALIHFHKADGC